MKYDPIGSDRHLIWTIRALLLVIAIGGILTFRMFLSGGTAKIEPKDLLTFLGFGGIL